MENDFPKNGDKFYWVRSDTGDVCESTWIDGSSSCYFRKSIGNIFRSRTTAREAIARQQLKTEDKQIWNS